MDKTFEIYDVNAKNVDQTGFFCYMSKRKEAGFKQKREWLEARFSEGMKIKIVHETGARDTGFIEYIPGEYAWRAFQAPGYMVIHCLWVVGRGKEKGFGSALIKACLEDAKAQGKAGVVMLTTDRVWLAKKNVFLKNGFKEVDHAQGVFQLLVADFGSSKPVRFPTDWDARAQKFGNGLTILRTPQCPYIENGSNDILGFARAKGISARVHLFNSAKEVQAESPSPYGVFGTVLDGKLLAYHYLLQKDFDKLLVERG